MNSEIFPGSKRLVKGNVPSSSLLLIGPSGVGKTIFCKQFIYYGLLAGEPCVYVTASESPEELKNSMQNYGFNIIPYENNQMFRVIDCCSWRLGKRSSSDYSIGNQHDLLTAVSINIKKATKDLKNIRFVFDSISEITSMCNQDAVLNFLQTLAGRLRLQGSKAIFTVASGAHPSYFMNLLRTMFDGILEMQIDESGNELKRLFRIFSLKGATHKTSWTTFEISSKGIRLRSEAGTRCTLCSKLIDWEPILMSIDGKKYPFDTIECYNTYKKFKSVYGNNFE
jgi:KaiC/GvpD/RAD55 family RecA-like ATPase